MKLVSLEQLEILMLVAGSENPMQTALNVHRRWRYLLGAARAAAEGRMIDQSLPQVAADPTGYAARAEAILAALEEWMMEQSERPAPERG